METGTFLSQSIDQIFYWSIFSIGNQIKQKNRENFEYFR